MYGHVAFIVLIYFDYIEWMDAVWAATAAAALARSRRFIVAIDTIQ